MGEQNMRTIILSDSLAEEIHKVAQELGYTEEKQFIEDLLKEKVLEYKKTIIYEGSGRYPAQIVGKRCQRR